MAEKKRKMRLSPEERQRRSDLAKKLAEEGKIGGKQKGAGRPKKERAQEQVAERIREEGDLIFKALKDGLRAESASIKLKAALAMLDIETKEEEFKFKQEQKIYDNLEREELLELLQTRLQELEDKGISIPLKVSSDVEIIEEPAELNA